MIEFRGELSDNAKEFFMKKIVKKLYFLYLVAFICIAPFSLRFSYEIGVLRFIWVDLLCIAVLFLIVKIAFKKGNKDVLIKRVYVEGSHIFSVSSNGTHKFKIKSIKKVTDYGEFYFIEFPKFLTVEDIVCQKNLLKKGSLEEFEALFEDKLVRR